ncbi:hypothetical protein Q5H93_11125 [Hymenobacter sp. ASUV-10]|uniref:Uncharacterized protein n=1 Tax=Hymenobacter aranciens TaxID=3063996 RepID=A0ABT9BAI4_9BACT|nr:hypothetical protein [Hymenobacter sp. ASUV-10]MDO7875286.1 hypothetical protein [Hymenobacter sp. ASUV-10]
MNQDWLPSQDAKLFAFYTNFVANIDAATDALKLPASTFAVAKEAAQNWLDCYIVRRDAQKVLNDAQEACLTQAPLTEKAIRAAAKQIKSIINVPTKVLTSLELTSSGEAPQERAAAQAPVLKVTVELGLVVLKYVKHGHQMLDLYGCRTGETEFTKIDRFSLNRIEDRRPNRVPGQPEQRDYYAVFVDKDQQVGEQSATVSVVVGSRPGQ